MKMIHLPEIGSTNTYLMQAVEAGQPLAEGTVVWTTRQRAGRGQMGNRWESEPEMNLAFSLLLRPTWLHAARQFVLSEAVAVGICQALDDVAGDMRIKWPNDIYHDDRKVCGILIENRIVGSHLSESVVGVGINVNQTDWAGVAPNPVSLGQLLSEQGAGRWLDQEALLTDVVGRIERLYATLPDGADRVHRAFVSRLYRADGLHPYVDVATGEAFEAATTDVEPDGHLVLTDRDGRRRRYMFKEVHFVLPCGVTKE